MVGAKEFAINRKVIEKKKKNPIIEEISMPKSMKSHENGIREMTGSFLDKFHKNSFHLPETIENDIIAKRFPKMHKPHDVRTINPILEESDERKRHIHRKLHKDRVDFLRSRHHIEDKHREYEKHEEHEEISEELANRITYKVFQKIKNYLTRDSERSIGNKHIKLEISL